MPAEFAAGDALRSTADLDRVLPTADHLVLCLPATPETDNLLDRRRLGLLPAHAVVYNVGRGNAIDEDALADALALADTPFIMTITITADQTTATVRKTAHEAETDIPEMA